MITIKTNEVPGIIEVELDGEITENDIEEFKRYYSQKKKTQDKFNMLMVIKDLDYTLDGLVKDLKFDTTHLDEFEKVAVLSDRDWVELSSKVARYMPKVEIKHFDADERDKAIEWLI